MERGLECLVGIDSSQNEEAAGIGQNVPFFSFTIMSLLFFSPYSYPVWICHVICGLFSFGSSSCSLE